jgi:hypothetical protein
LPELALAAQPDLGNQGAEQGRLRCEKLAQPALVAQEFAAAGFGGLQGLDAAQFGLPSALDLG